MERHRSVVHAARRAIRQMPGRASLLVRIVLLLATTILAGPPAAYADTVPPPPNALGGEFQVNTTSANEQGMPNVAMDQNGNFVVVWQSRYQDGDEWGIYGQRYNAAGVAQGSEFQINTTTASHQDTPVIAMAPNGNFVVSWNSYFQDGSDCGVYAQRYNAAGERQGDEFLVNTTTANTQSYPSIAMSDAGDFVIAWHSMLQDGSSNGVYAQRYNAAGVAQGSEFQVNTTTQYSQNGSVVAMDPDGKFVIAWGSFAQDGGQGGVYAQRYNAAGVAQGDEFRVNTTTAGDQGQAAIGMSRAGDFVITWQSNNQDGSAWGVYGQRYNAAGVAQGGEFRANTYTTNMQFSPSVALDADGDFTVVWQSTFQDGTQYSVYGQRYNAAGVAQDDEFRVNTYTTGDQQAAVIAMAPGGNHVVAWVSDAQDGDNRGIFAQRFGTAVAGPPTATNLTQTKPYVEDAVSVDLDDIVVSDPTPDGPITARVGLDNPNAGRLTTSGAATYNALSGLWTISGTAAEVNAALADVAFVPATDASISTVIGTVIKNASDAGPPHGIISLNGTARNDAPQFTVGANQSIAQNAGAQSVTGWATGMRPGPVTATDEASQALTFQANAAGALTFTTPPAIAANGTLTYQVAPTSSGVSTVSVTLQDDGGTANGGTNTSAPQTFTITVAGPPPVASVADASVQEGASGTATLTFGVTLSASSAQTVTVEYTTVAGSGPTAAVGGPGCVGSMDFVMVGGTVTFAPGDTAKSVPVTVCGDTVAEPGETLTLTLSSPTNATLGDAQATGTILNDDQTVACSPRPPVLTRTSVSGTKQTGVISVSPLNTSAANAITQLRFGQITNGKVTYNGQQVASGQVFPVSPGMTSVSLTVERVTAGQPTTVPVTVTDSCGDWPTFVGGGTSGGF